MVAVGVFEWCVWGCWGGVTVVVTVSVGGVARVQVCGNWEDGVRGSGGREGYVDKAALFASLQEGFPFMVVLYSSVSAVTFHWWLGGVGGCHR